jgi:hypothetical protein
LGSWPTILWSSGCSAGDSPLPTNVPLDQTRLCSFKEQQFFPTANYSSSSAFFFRLLQVLQVFFFLDFLAPVQHLQPTSFVLFFVLFLFLFFFGFSMKKKEKMITQQAALHLLDHLELSFPLCS